VKAGVIKEGTVDSISSGVLEVTRLLTDQLSFSVAKIKLNGENRPAKNLICDATYYILEGNGRFSIENIETEVSKGDIVFLPRGTAYQDKGHMIMLNVCQPPFNPEQVQYLDLR